MKSERINGKCRRSSHVVGGLFFAAVLCASSLAASVTEKPRHPDWPQPVRADTILATLDEADTAILSYGDNLSASISDPAWLAEFKRTLAGASLRPTPLCLCINTPQVTLLKGGTRIARLEFPHAQKLRILGSDFNGDYLIGEERAKRLIALVMRLEAKATRDVSPVPAKNPKPTKVEIRP